MTEEDDILTSARSVNSDPTKEPTAPKQIPDVVSRITILLTAYVLGLL